MTAFKITHEMDADAADRIGLINDVLDRLTVRRVERILVEGPFEKSKLAWKVATYNEALLYRVVALSSGCALSWNRGDVLGAVLAARALLETVAVLMDLDTRLARMLDQEDLAGIDTLIMKRTFSTRDEDWRNEYPDSVAVNILTIIEDVDKKEGLNGMMKDYHAALSELCHPNHGGLLGLFGTLKHQTGETTYSDRKLPNFRPVLGAMLFITLAEHAFDHANDAVLRLADLQHRIKPVRRSDG